ncbi:hypothetical protein RZS08_16820 [Arthrospira platensis SPKY1]|nr:hypothetical protein [Arthrospira platensis SPKY1]
MLHPDDGRARAARPCDGAADILDDSGRVPRPLHDADLGVDNDQNALVAWANSRHFKYLPMGAGYIAGEVIC